ncbi:unnamed protein product [Polarella glacialis]|uniref:Uncharacterized protein n=1 Tax=Polarella glacialis TaxID=89957 RepID=A0A813F1H0_POLGL|nr:unnamed protein product [Polarella glacialis]
MLMESLRGTAEADEDSTELLMLPEGPEEPDEADEPDEASTELPLDSSETVSNPEHQAFVITVVPIRDGKDSSPKAEHQREELPGLVGGDPS